jgi:hypothetical protein
MIVIVSDLRLTDGSLGPSPSAAGIRCLARQLFEVAALRRQHSGGEARPVKSIDLLLLGDTIDLMQSNLWLDHAERPWHDPYAPGLFDLIARITERILEHNAAALKVFQEMAESAVPVRIHCMVGDCDWPFHLLGPSYNRLRSRVAKCLGLATATDQPFPHDPAESEVLFDVFRRHRVIARHGDIYDPIHFDEDRNASSLGDAIAIEIVGRFQREVRAGFPEELSSVSCDEFASLGCHRPLVLAPAQIEAVLERSDRSAALKQEIKSLWDCLVDRFVEMPFVRTRRAWNPVDLVDGLLDLLKFSRRAASGRTGALVSWLRGGVQRGEASRAILGHSPEIDFAVHSALPSIERITGSAATWPNFLVVFAADECRDRPFLFGRADRRLAHLESRSAA